MTTRRDSIQKKSKNKRKSSRTQSARNNEIESKPEPIEMESSNEKQGPSRNELSKRSESKKSISSSKNISGGKKLSKAQQDKLNTQNSQYEENVAEVSESNSTSDTGRKTSQIYPFENKLDEEAKTRYTSFVLKSGNYAKTTPTTGTKQFLQERRNTLYEVKGAPTTYGIVQMNKINMRIQSFLNTPEMVLESTTGRSSCAYFIKKRGRKHSDLYFTTVSEVSDFVQETLNVLAVDDEISSIFSEALIEADHLGLPNQGLASFIDHVLDVTGKTSYSNILPQIIEESGATAWVDGMRALAPILGKFCMELAMEKASKVGVGIVSVKNSPSSFYGYWIAEMAKKNGFIGLWCSNTSPVMCPTGGLRAALGMQPMVVSAPAGFDELLFHLLATSLSIQTINEHLETNKPLQENAAYGKNKNLTKDPKEILDAKRLLPLGRTRILGSARGYGFGILVEILTGIISGSRYGPFVVTKEEIEDEPMDLGQCFIAVDPHCFAPDFEFRLGAFLDEMKDLEPIDKNKPVLIPGESHRFHKRMLEVQGGLIYPKSVIKATNFIAQKLHIDPMKVSTVN